MAETARQVISDALRMIFVTGDEEPIQAVDMQRGIRTLNRMMAAFESEGVDLASMSISEPTDEIDIDAGAFRGVISCLAYELYPYMYAKDAPMTLLQVRNSGKEDLIRIATVLEDMDFPDTLPVGSGNSGATFFTVTEE